VPHGSQLYELGVVSKRHTSRVVVLQIVAASYDERPVTAWQMKRAAEVQELRLRRAVVHAEPPSFLRSELVAVEAAPLKPEDALVEPLFPF